MAEWSNAGGCKPPGVFLHKFESCPAHKSADLEVDTSRSLLFVVTDKIRKELLAKPDYSQE